MINPINPHTSMLGDAGNGFYIIKDGKCNVVRVTKGKYNNPNYLLSNNPNNPSHNPLHISS